MKANCPYCNNIIIKDWEKFLKEDSFKYIQCPYCGKHILKNEINKEI